MTSSTNRYGPAPVQPASTGEPVGTTPSSPTRPINPVPTRRRPLFLALWVALTAVFALAGWWYIQSAGRTTTVVAAVVNLQRGETIEAADLRTVTLPVSTEGLNTLSAEDLDSLIGQVATVDIPAGATLTPASVAPQLQPATGSSIVGIYITATQMPTQQLQAGDQVRVVSTPTQQADTPVADPETLPATVISVVTIDTGQYIVNVEVPTEVAPTLAARAATGRIAIVIDTIGS